MTSSRTISRRGLLSAGAGLSSAALLAACMPSGGLTQNAPTIPPADGPVRLTYWAWLKDLQLVCDVWNAQNPNIQVEAVWIPGGAGGGYSKMYAALEAGGGPDLAQIELRSVAEFMLVGGLVDLVPYGANDNAALYDPTLWGQVSFNDGVYAVPQDSGPTGFFYRTDLLEAIGASAPPTWDAWAELAAEVRQTGAYLEAYPLNDSSLLAAYAAQAGAVWIRPEDDTWVINMTDDASLEVADFFDRAIDNDLVTTAYGTFSPPWYGAAADDGIVATTVASWGDALIETVAGTDGLWNVAPMPVWPDGYGSTAIGGSTAAVLANSQHPYEALQFATWMTTSREGIDAMIQHSGIGWSPARDYIGEVRQQPSEFFGGQNYNEEVFVPAAAEQNPDWTWWPLTQQAFEVLGTQAIRKSQGQSLVESLRIGEANIIDAFRNKGLSIRKEA